MDSKTSITRKRQYRLLVPFDWGPLKARFKQDEIAQLLQTSQSTIVRFMKKESIPPHLVQAAKNLCESKAATPTAFSVMEQIKYHEEILDRLYAQLEDGLVEAHKMLEERKFRSAGK